MSLLNPRAELNDENSRTTSDVAGRRIPLRVDRGKIDNDVPGWWKARTGSRSRVQIASLLEPDSKTVHVYRSRSDIAIYRTGEMVDVSDVVKDWRFSVDEIFP